MKSREWPKISMVVPVRNEERFVARTLQQLLDQDYPADRMEILVGVADSTDSTAEIVQEIAARESRVKYFRNPHGVSAGARNGGVRLSSGEIIIFIDGHVYIDNNALLRNTAVLMEEKAVSILSRPQFLDPPDNTFFQRAVSLARKSWIGHGLDSTIYTKQDKSVDPTSSGSSYRREIFERVGFFDTSFDACEDVEFNYRCARAGYRSFTSMRLAVYYYPRTSLGKLFRQMMRYGAGRYRLARKHPRTLSLSSLLPAMLIIIIPLLGVLALITPDVLFALATVLLLYFSAIGLNSLSISATEGFQYLPVIPIIYLAIHIGLGLGFMCQLLGPQ
jgi:glycosyltransferase involved in cell wall biosynthesis